MRKWKDLLYQNAHCGIAEWWWGNLLESLWALLVLVMV